MQELPHQLLLARRALSFAILSHVRSRNLAVRARRSSDTCTLAGGTILMRKLWPSGRQSKLVQNHHHQMLEKDPSVTAVVIKQRRSNIQLSLPRSLSLGVPFRPLFREVGMYNTLPGKVHWRKNLQKCS